MCTGWQVTVMALFDYLLLLDLQRLDLELLKDCLRNIMTKQDQVFNIAWYNKIEYTILIIMILKKESQYFIFTFF